MAHAQLLGGGELHLVTVAAAFTAGKYLSVQSGQQ